jgi:NAD(P)-dependent dehydrogenase (short-subunit alcohol dehydrogenase family)
VEPNGVLVKTVFKDKIILLTGGTGSFGRAFTRRLVREHAFRALRILSRDELKQSEMRAEIQDERLRFFLGDVRDAERLHRAMRDVDFVVHAAALKQIPACEYNPFEAVKTNILGAQNIVEAAIESSVEKVVALSTDKAVNPVNLYGAIRPCAAKIGGTSNTPTGGCSARLAGLRHGHAAGSRRTVIPLLLLRKQRRRGLLTSTGPRITRVGLSLHGAVQLVFDAIGRPREGERTAPLQRGIEVAEWISRRSRLTALRSSGLPWVAMSGSGGIESKPFARPAPCGSSACVRMSSCCARKSEIKRSRPSRRLAMGSQADIPNAPLMQTGDQSAQAALERLPAARGRHLFQGQAASSAQLAWEQSTRPTIPRRVASLRRRLPHAARAVVIVVPTIVQDQMSF